MDFFLVEEGKRKKKCLPKDDDERRGWRRGGKTIGKSGTLLTTFIEVRRDAH